MKSLIVIGVIAGILALLGFGYLGFSNQANRFEVGIPNIYNNNKNVYDNGWKKVKEMAQIPEMQTQDLAKVYDGVMKGRYGANGSQALLQFIKEQNPNLNQDTYLKIQRAIESFHDEFQANQTKLISMKQEYGNYLFTNTNSRFYNGFLGIAQSYPRIKCGVPDGSEDKYAILTSDKTETEFQNHKADELKIR